MINNIVQMGILAMLTKFAYTLGEVYSPKVKINPSVEHGEKDELERFVDRLRDLEKGNKMELTERFPLERIDQIKRRELHRYKLAQEKKWRNWLDAVSH